MRDRGALKRGRSGYYVCINGGQTAIVLTYSTLQMLNTQASGLAANGDPAKTIAARDSSREPSPSLGTATKIYPTNFGSKWQICHHYYLPSQSIYFIWACLSFLD